MPKRKKPNIDSSVVNVYKKPNLMVDTSGQNNNEDDPLIIINDEVDTQMILNNNNNPFIKPTYNEILNSSDNELCSILKNKLSLLDSFGETGGQSTIKQIVNDDNKNDVLLIKYPKPTNNERHIKEVDNICDILNNLPEIKGINKPRCLKCVIYGDKENAIMIEHKLEGMTLKKYLYKHKNEPGFSDKLGNVIKQIINIIHTLHINNIYHNDVHCDNIYITPDENIFLIDYGTITNDYPRNTEYKIQNTIKYPIIDILQLLKSIKNISNLPNVFELYYDTYALEVDTKRPFIFNKYNIDQVQIYNNIMNIVNPQTGGFYKLYKNNKNSYINL